MNDEAKRNHPWFTDCIYCGKPGMTTIYANKEKGVVQEDICDLCYEEKVKR